jgi:hypothetical protein
VAFDKAWSDVIEEPGGVQGEQGQAGVTRRPTGVNDENGG